jgi:hypothetical protein
VLTRGDLVLLLAPTYARARGVDEEEAAERLARALAVPAALDELYGGISSALADAKGPRTRSDRRGEAATPSGARRGVREDALLDRLSSAVAARRARAKAAEATPAVSAVLVRLDLEVGLAPEAMRATLASPRGRALLDEGLRAVGAHLVKHLLRG